MDAHFHQHRLLGRRLGLHARGCERAVLAFDGAFFPRLSKDQRSLSSAKLAGTSATASHSAWASRVVLGQNFNPRRSWGTFRRAVSSIACTKLPLSESVKSWAAAMIYKDGELLSTTQRGADPLACSYAAETVALYEGLRKLLTILPAENPTPCRVSVFSDSPSLLKALQAAPLTVTDPMLRKLWNLILQVQRRKARIRLQFIFGHCGVEKNEKCDAEAKKAAEHTQRNGAWIPDVIAYAKRILKGKAHLALLIDGKAQGTGTPPKTTPN
ncbi:Ribonuclease H domain [Trypanosoma melophagium]|uniref:Ribonuclease H domain n=1 Tax=Trypanosoma melophagium TaxID=715481 RepID=UPI00351A2A01|nr:Ribonuclease H domain [Trypanosoma melophagium]